MRRKVNILRHQGTAVQFSRRNLLVCQEPHSAPCSTLHSCPSHRACPRSGGQAGFPMPLLYTTFPFCSNNALRCDGKCSALRRPTQHAAMTFAPRCDFFRTSLPDGKESDRIPSTTAFHLTRNRFYRQTRSNFKTEAKPFPEQEQNFSKTEAKPFPNNRDTIPRHAKSPPPDMGEGLLQLNIYIPAAAHELSICNCMPEIKTGQSSPFAPPRQNPEKLQQSPFAPSWQKPVPTIPPLAFGQTAARTAFCLCRPNDALLPVAGQMLSTASTSMSSFLTILSLLMALENGTYTTSSFLMPIITLRCPSRIA